MYILRVICKLVRLSRISIVLSDIYMNVGISLLDVFRASYLHYHKHETKRNAIIYTK